MNIYKIAEEAGVSVATVSRFFSDPDIVNKKTREKIGQICNKYSYRPSKIARAIKTKRTNLIAFIMPSLKETAFIDIIAGAEKTLTDSGYTLCLLNTRQDIKRQKRIINTLQSMNIDGVLFSGIYGNEEEKQFISHIKKRQVPIILVDRIIPGSNLSYVMNNDYLGGQIAAKILLKNNHRNIGIITYSREVYIFNQRIKGFIDELKRNKISESFIIEIPLEYKKISKALETKKDHILNNEITAIFCASDSIAIFLNGILNENNINIPEQVSLVGFDNIIFSNYISPRLTTIDHDMFNLGKIAAEELIYKLKNGRFRNKNIVIDPVLIERDSVKKL